MREPTAKEGFYTETILFGIELLTLGHLLPSLLGQASYQALVYNLYNPSDPLLKGYFIQLPCPFIRQ